MDETHWQLFIFKKYIRQNHLDKNNWNVVVKELRPGHISQIKNMCWTYVFKKKKVWHYILTSPGTQKPTIAEMISWLMDSSIYRNLMGDSFNDWSTIIVPAIHWKDWNGNVKHLEVFQDFHPCQFISWHSKNRSCFFFPVCGVSVSAVW